MAFEPSDQPDAQISSVDAIAYWSSVSPTVNGMLAGFPQVSATDLKGSYLFYQKLLRLQPSQPSNLEGEKEVKRGLDCGAGIGRVTQGFLSRVCAVVDIIEPIPLFAEQARGCLADCSPEAQIGKVYTQSLEAFSPAADHPKYHMIWIQWCAGHLTDNQFISFLRICNLLMRDEHSWIGVKENLSTDKQGRDVFDPTDSTVTRSLGSWERLFKDAGLVVLRTELQKGMPVRGLLPVRMWALKAQ